MNISPDFARRILLLCASLLFACDGGSSGDPPGLGGDGSSGGGTGPLNGDPQSICNQLVKCVSATGLGGASSTIAAYGAGGSCWKGFSRDECRRQCLQATVALHETYQSVDDCNVCDDASDCVSSAPLCNVATHRCYQCETNDDCLEERSRYLCDPERKTCVGCVSRLDCGGSLPACHPEKRWCTECDSHADCEANHPDRPSCDPDTFMCVNCKTNDDCSRTSAGKLNVCFTLPDFPPYCAECKTNLDCSAALPLCDPWGFCGECETNEDCIGFGGDTRKTYRCERDAERQRCVAQETP